MSGLMFDPDLVARIWSDAAGAACVLDVAGDALGTAKPVFALRVPRSP